MKKIDLTYGGKLKTLFNTQKKVNLNVNYTVDGKTGKPTTTSICICLDPLFMITFDYQDLKELVGDNKLEEENKNLKEELHESSIEIQHLIEQDAYCPTNCGKLGKYQSKIEKALKIIDSYNLGKYDYSIPPGGIIELKETLQEEGEEDGQ